MRVSMTAQHKIAGGQSVGDNVIPGSICVIGSRHFGPGFIAYGWNAKKADSLVEPAFLFIGMWCAGRDSNS